MMVVIVSVISDFALCAMVWICWIEIKSLKKEKGETK